MSSAIGFGVFYRCDAGEMSGWAGFSEAELRRMQQTDAARGRKAAPAGRNRQQFQREKALQVAAAAAGSAGLPPDQQLAEPPPKEEPRPAAGPAAGPAVGPGAPAATPEMRPNGNQQQAAAEEEEPPPVRELEKQQVEMREKTRLEQLQLEQKVIEETNKRKKALLAKTIAEKSKQTQAEAVKLRRIQKELQALDDMVSNDIGILRGRIEQASWEYTAARKRYEKAEAEYVTAKLDLHKKTEVKEQLTEHLYAIIQQNEQRKAHKLEELMEQLQLQATEEELEKLREEEEEEEKRRRRRDKGNGSVENQEEAVPSSKDCGGEEVEEEAVKEEKGGAVQEEQQEAIGASGTEQEAETPGDCLQGGTEAS
ncbi:RAB6-interacting golgin isoform X2 [Brachyistius frenatus]|uniref:RAB6-interacting golgin isoform X2 n=1 Tax=Brachyistius frenatus TaxID=100188 RepID=UPI0037E9668A